MSPWSDAKPWSLGPTPSGKLLGEESSAVPSELVGLFLLVAASQFAAPFATQRAYTSSAAPLTETLRTVFAEAAAHLYRMESAALFMMEV
jgi:hypothetical protein